MRQTRRTLLAVLAMAVVMTLLHGSVSVSSASPNPIRIEPIAPPAPPPGTDLGPTQGEPDSGSSRSQQVHPFIRRGSPSGNTQYSQALSVVRWTSLFWAKRVLGIGS
jgi:hypothetical protein